MFDEVNDKIDMDKFISFYENEIKDLYEDAKEICDSQDHPDEDTYTITLSGIVLCCILNKQKSFDGEINTDILSEYKEEWLQKFTTSLNVAYILWNMESEGVLIRSGPEMQPGWSIKAQSTPSSKIS